MQMIEKMEKDLLLEQQKFDEQEQEDCFGAGIASKLRLSKRHEICAIKHGKKDILFKHQMKKTSNQISIPTPRLTSPTY